METSEQTPQYPLANYQFSSEELRILRECNTESFFQRSLPFGIGLGTSAYFAVKNDYIRPNVKYGAVPKVIVGVVVGYFLGKFSYQQKCAEKLMRLPNSKLGEILRQRQQGGSKMNLTSDPSLGVGLPFNPFSSGTSDVYSDENLNESSRSSALNLDIENRPDISGLDDVYRPTLESSLPHLETDLPLEPQKSGTSYDELRKQNREEYDKRQQSQLSNPMNPRDPIGLQLKNSKPKPTHPEAPQKKVNKYGDAWID